MAPDPRAADTAELHITVGAVHELSFGPGDPVRAASAIAPFEGRWLIAQDDATAAAWWRPAGPAARVRLFDAITGLDTFEEAAGTKHLKPDVESACAVPTRAGKGVLLLGSGSLPARTRAVLVVPTADGPVARTADLAPVYDRVRAALGLVEGALNLEGACVVGDRLRWFQRGHGRSGTPSASVDVDLAALVAAVASGGDGRDIVPTAVRRYDLGTIDGQPLTITDAVALGDGTVLASAAAEDTADAVADGPVAGSALAVLRGDLVVATGVVPVAPGRQPWKVEGVALRSTAEGELGLLAVTDADDPAIPSLAVELHVRGLRVPGQPIAPV